MSTFVMSCACMCACTSKYDGALTTRNCLLLWKYGYANNCMLNACTNSSII